MACVKLYTHSQVILELSHPKDNPHDTKTRYVTVLCTLCVIVVTCLTVVYNDICMCYVLHVHVHVSVMV